MAIKVIGAGYGRTGTLSLKVALEQLGFDKSHHMMEVGKSLAQINHWSRIAAGGEPRWDEVFADFQSTTDFPACAYYESLAEHYPDAKVVLTVRDTDSWYRSVMQTIWLFKLALPGWLRWIAPPIRRLSAAVDQIVWDGVFDGRANDPEHAKAVFEAHNKAVVERIPADRLLVFEVKEGWQPLCDFLGVAVPDSEFPHVNDTAEMQQRVRIMRILGWLPLVAAIGLGYWIFA